MADINKDRLIKILILLGFIVFFGKIIFNGEVMNYVHPRIIPFIYASLILFIIMIIFLMVQGIFNDSENVKFKMQPYMIFIFLLFFIFYMEFSSMNKIDISSENSIYKSRTTEELAMNNGNKSAGDSAILNSQENSTSSQNFQNSNYNNVDYGNGESLNKIELREKDGVICIDRDNFVSSLDMILSNADKYTGRKVEVSGFVYKNENLGQNEFVIGRYMMVCCAADLQIAGIICRSPESNKFASDTWIKVKGKIAKESDEAVIDAESITIDDNPDKQYVYPY